MDSIIYLGWGIVAISLTVALCSWIYIQLVAVPRARRELGTALEEEDERYEAIITAAKAKVEKQMQSETDPVRRKALEAFLANYEYVTLFNLYVARNAGFEGRADFKRRFVQKYYEENKERLAALGRETDIDIACEFNDKVLTEYRGLSEQYMKLTRSEMKWLGSERVNLAPSAFFYLKVGHTDIPVFYDQDGTALFIYPSFCILFRGGGNIAFADIKDLNIRDFTSEESSDTPNASAPSDSMTVRYRWQYMTKKGEPDGRYSYNPRYITYKVGRLTIEVRNEMKLNYTFSAFLVPALFRLKFLCLIPALMESHLPMGQSVRGGSTPDDEDGAPIMTNEEMTRKLAQAIQADPMLVEILRFASCQDELSTSSLQRHFEIGYNKAGRYTDLLESLHIVGPFVGAKPRIVLVDSFEMEDRISMAQQLIKCGRQ